MIERPEMILGLHHVAIIASGEASIDFYTISTLCAVNDIIELKLVEQEAPIMNWSGESAISFF